MGRPQRMYPALALHNGTAQWYHTIVLQVDTDSIGNVICKKAEELNVVVAVSHGFSHAFSQ